MDTLPLLTGEIKDFVKKVKLAFVATVCPDGTPNLSPKGNIITGGDKHLAFADIYSPGTTANLLQNLHRSQYRGYIFEKRISL